MSTSTINHINRPVWDQLIFERRMLLGCTAAVGVCILVWTIAISTDYWFYVDVNTADNTTVSSNSGLFRICRIELQRKANRTLTGNSTAVHIKQQNKNITKAIVPQANVTLSPNKTLIGTKPKIRQRVRICDYPGFHTDKETRKNLTIDDAVLSYSRTEVSFAIITFLIMVMAFTFSVYTFRNPRYTFKRCAGALHFITAATVLVVIEVIIASIGYEKDNENITYPLGAEYTYGYSMYLAWLVFLTLLYTGFCFMLYSRKKKGNKAPTDELAMADEPTIMGR